MPAADGCDLQPDHPHSCRLHAFRGRSIETESAGTLQGPVDLRHPDVTFWLLIVRHDVGRSGLPQAVGAPSHPSLLLAQAACSGETLLLSARSESSCSYPLMSPAHAFEAMLHATVLPSPPCMRPRAVRCSMPVDCRPCRWSASKRCSQPVSCCADAAWHVLRAPGGCQ